MNARYKLGDYWTYKDADLKTIFCSNIEPTHLSTIILVAALNGLHSYLPPNNFPITGILASGLAVVLFLAPLLLAAACCCFAI